MKWVDLTDIALTLSKRENQRGIAVVWQWGKTTDLQFTPAQKKPIFPSSFPNPTTHLPCSIITLNMYTNKKRSTLATNKKKLFLEKLRNSVFILQMENKP